MVERIVADASVIVKWYVNEIWSDKSIMLRDMFIDGSVEIHVPSLLFYEVLNALRYNKDFPVDLLKDVYESLISYGFTIYTPKERHIYNALEAVLKYEITIYDAVYLGLAAYLGTKLVTTDQKLIDKVKGSRYYEVVHVKDVV